MSTQIKRNEFLKACKTVKPGLGTSEEIEQSTYYGFTDGRVFTFNDEIMISHPIDGMDEMFTGAIHAKELHGFLSKLKKEDIAIESSKNRLHLKSGRAKVEFAVLDLFMPINEIKMPSNWQPLPEDFSEKVNFVLPCTAKELSRPIFNCVHVNEAGYVEATDNYRIARAAVSKETPLNTFLLPAKAAKEVVKVKPTHFAIQGGSASAWTHFITEDETIISCRTYADRFFDTSSFVQVDGVDIIFPDGIDEILSRAEVFMEGSVIEEQSVEIVVDEGELTVKSASIHGKFSESIDMNYTGEKITFLVAPKLLKQIINQTMIGTITAQRDRIAFSGDDWIYVAMLRV